MLWDNPIWSYRIRSRRWRSLSLPARWGILALLLLIAAAGSAAVAAGAVYTMTSGLAGALAGGSPGGLYVIYSVGAAIWAALCGSTAIAPDRQRGIWEGLVVSGLSDREIILGKFAAALWPTGLLALWALPIWLAPFLLDPEQIDTSMPLALAALWASLRALARPLPFAALGLYISFRSRSQSAATGTTMALLAPLLLASLATFMGYPPTEKLAPIAIWFFAHSATFPPAPTTDFALPTIGCLFSLLCDLIWIVAIPLGVLALLIKRFRRLDRWVRGDPGGRRAGRSEATNNE